MLGQHVPGLVASENIVLKVQRLLRGVDYLCSRTESIRANVDDAKRRIAGVLTRGNRKMAAQRSLLRVCEGYRLTLRKISTGRTPRTSVQRHRGEQQQDME
jgi:hypothetical protein